MRFVLLVLTACSTQADSQPDPRVGTAWGPAWGPDWEPTYVWGDPGCVESQESGDTGDTGVRVSSRYTFGMPDGCVQGGWLTFTTPGTVCSITCDREWLDFGTGDLGDPCGAGGDLPASVTEEAPLYLWIRGPNLLAPAGDEATCIIEGTGGPWAFEVAVGW